jgi:hypothetical protein
LPLLIFLEPDSVSFHVWNRHVNNLFLRFNIDSNRLVDANTNSFWNYDGLCTEGELKGTRLKPIKASQEFWHSWKTFYPYTTLYHKK